MTPPSDPPAPVPRSMLRTQVTAGLGWLRGRIVDEASSLLIGGGLAALGTLIVGLLGTTMSISWWWEAAGTSGPFTVGVGCLILSLLHGRAMRRIRAEGTQQLADHATREAALKVREKELDEWEVAGAKELERAELYRRSVRSSIKDGAYTDCHVLPAESHIKDGVLVATVQIINRLNVIAEPLRGVVWFGISIEGLKIGEADIELPATFLHDGFSGVHTFQVRRELPPDVWAKVRAQCAAVVGGNVWGYREKRLRDREEPSIWFGIVDCWLPVVRSEESDVRP